jgi:hypothetical protein
VDHRKRTFLAEELPETAKPADPPFGHQHPVNGDSERSNLGFVMADVGFGQKDLVIDRELVLVPKHVDEPRFEAAESKRSE